MSTLSELLAEAATFHSRLTADVHVSALAKRLCDGLAPLSLQAENPFCDVCDGSGLYYLEAKFPFRTYAELDAFGTQWGKVKAMGVPPGLPRYYVGRAKKQKKRIAAGDFVPFYLGKEMNVQSRLSGHMDGKLEASTYALKLKERAEIFQHIDLRFSFVEIPVEERAYFCLALLEKALRDRFNPIIGRQ
jgi:hypothetical protein